MAGRDRYQGPSATPNRWTQLFSRLNGHKGKRSLTQASMTGHERSWTLSKNDLGQISFHEISHHLSQIGISFGG